jgi:hypothetical protein
MQFTSKWTGADHARKVANAAATCQREADRVHAAIGRRPFCHGVGNLLKTIL